MFRRALPLLSIIVIAGGLLSRTDVFDDGVEVFPPETVEMLRASVADSQEHLGGIQRFALLQLSDHVAVRVEDESSHGQPNELIVTIYEVDPTTGRMVFKDGKPSVLEVHRNLSNATISQLESDYALFYYLTDG